MKYIIITLAVVILFGAIKVLADEPVKGCTNPSARNYEPLATLDDGSCMARPQSSANPLTLTQPLWGMTGIEIINAGLFLKSGEGACPAWFPNGCFKLK